MTRRLRSGPPTLIAINHDDYHAEHIGKTADGRQFLLTTPFQPASEVADGCEYVAIYFFSRDGQFLDARIDSFGPRSDMDDVHRKRVYDTWLAELGAASFQRIEIAPFCIERFGTRFGLIPRPPKDEDDVWAVELQPGNYMAFFEPWDSGDYDT